MATRAFDENSAEDVSELCARIRAMAGDAKIVVLDTWSGTSRGHSALEAMADIVVSRDGKIIKSKGE